MSIWLNNRWITRFLFIAIGCLVLALAGSGIMFYQAQTDHEFARENLLLEKGEIERLDEVLTMSARLYASTGDDLWRNRYLNAVPKLDEALHRAKSLSLQISGINPLEQTESANSILISLEAEVLQKAGHGELAAATRILDSSRYIENKALYAEGMKKLWDGLAKHSATQAAHLRTVLWSLLFLAIFAVGVILIIWRFVAEKAWIYERSQQALQNSDSLDDRNTAFMPAVVVFLFGFVLTCGICWFWLDQTHQNAKIRFDRLSERLATEVTRQSNQIVYALKSARGLYSINKSVSAEQFNHFVQSLDLARDFPGALGIGFIDRVKRDELANYIESKRTSAAPDFDVRTEGNAEDLYIVSMIEPQERNRAALGFDIGSETLRRKAAIHAIESGEPIVTDKITLVQDGSSRTGLLFYLPVYRTDAAILTPQARTAALQGLIYAPLILSDVLEKVSDITLGQLDFELFDGENTSPSNLLYDDDAHLKQTNEIENAYMQRRFVTRTLINVGGRSWTLTASSRPAFEDNHDFTTPIAMGASGFLLSALSGALLLIMGQQRRRALATAREITADLSNAKRDAEQARAQAEANLRESSTLFKALESHSIISITDRSGRIQSANDEFCRISGFSREELLGQNHRILNSGHHSPKFWTEMWETVASGKAWHGQVCNKRKNGTLYWVDSTIVPFFDERGRIEKYASIRFDITALREYQQTLDESRQQLDLVITSTGAGTWDWHIQTGELTLNERWAEIIGYTLEELEPISIDTWLQLAHPDDLLESNQLLEMHWRGETDRYTHECRIQHKRGHWIWVLDSGSVVEWSVDGKPLRMVGTHIDISPQKNAENAIRLSEERYRNLADSLNDVIFTSDAKTIAPIYVNKAVELVWGYTVEEWLTNPLSFINSLHPEDKENVIDQVQSRLKSGLDHFNLEYRIITKHGGIRWIHTAISILRDESGVHTGFSGICSDVTAQKLAADKLARQQSMLEQMSRQARIGAWEADIVTHKLMWSAMTKIIHEVEDDFSPDLETAIHFYKEGENRETIRKLVDAAIADGTPFSAELQIITAKGREIWVAATGHAQLKNGKCVRLYGSFQDIDARKRVQQELNQAKNAAEAAARAKSEFLATMSHEIRTPMNGVIGMLALLQKSRLEPEQERKIAIAKSSADSLLTLINDILDFSKVDAGKLELEQIDFDLSQSIRETAEALALRAEEKGVSLILDLTGMESDYAKGDPGRVRQIFNNLIGNAVKFTDKGEIRIHCALRVQEENLLFSASISDTGIGIAADKLDLLFNSFTQGDASTTRKYGGTGLGLAITKKLCHLMGGNIDVRSELGKGSEFSFNLRFKPSELSTLNRAALPAKAIEEIPLLPIWPANIQILLVEDNPVNQEVAQLLLADFGLSCALANNGVEALKIMRTKADQSFNLILMDCQMPELDGYETTRAIRAGESGDANKAVPIIAMTANALKEDRDKCIAAGMSDYLSKPIEADQFLEILKRWLLPVPETDTADQFKPANATVPTNSNIDADSLPLWDEEAALAVVKNKKERLRMLLTMFCESTPESLATLQKAILEENFEQMELIAHTLKGSTGQLKSPRTAQLAAQLNLACKQKDMSAVRHVAPDVVSACAQLLLRFERYLAEYPN